VPSLAAAPALEARSCRPRRTYDDAGEAAVAAEEPAEVLVGEPAVGGTDGPAGGAVGWLTPAGCALGAALAVEELELDELLDDESSCGSSINGAAG
jgi:hypothetical protein